MDKKIISDLIRSTETFRIEKTISTKDSDKFCQAICAFSNDLPKSGKPGYLLVGVNDDGSLSGLRVTDELLQFFAGLRTDGNILPMPVMAVDYVPFDEGDVIVVKVDPSTEPPVRYKGRCYIRIGPRKDIATLAEENILSEKRLSAIKSFDMRACQDASLEDLDLELFSRLYLPKAVAEDVLSTEKRDVKEQMASLRLYDRQFDRPTNAAVLLFGKNTKYFFPGAYIQYVLFDGLDNAAEILNQNEFSGNLLTMLPRLEAFVETAVVQKRPSPVSMLQEEIMVNYPQWAVRELLMNAVMHRDYSGGNTPTKFYQYADRLEIVNPGGLFGNARPENFPDVNDYRNPVIAEALKVMGYVNKFNRGIARVQKELVDNGNGKALFTVDKITVFAVNVTNSKANNVSNPANKVVAPVDVASLSFSRKSLSVLALCLEGPQTKKEILSAIRVTNQTNNVRNIINPLIEAGCLAPIGEDDNKKRRVRYCLTDRGIEYLSLHPKGK